MILLDCIQKQDHIPFKFANSSTFAMSAFQESSLHIFWLHSNKQRSNPIFRSMYIRLEEQTCLMALRTLSTQYTSQETNLARRPNRMARDGQKWCSAL